MAALAVAGEGGLFLIDYAARLLRVALLLSLWRLVLANRGKVGGFVLDSILTYTLLSEALSDPLNCRLELPEALWQGTLATRMVQPLSLVAQFASEAAGRWMVSAVLFSLPLLLLAPVLGVHVAPAGTAACILFAASFVLAVAIGLAMEFLYGSVLVYFDLSPWSLERLRRALTVILSGSVIPLALMPWGIGSALSWLPFASMASAPLTIYTGVGNPLAALGIQALWAVALWPAALGIWNANRQRLAGHGG